MKLGLQMGYWGAGPPQDAIQTIQHAERLGFDSVWTSEAYGSDAISPIAWWGAHTSKIRLGTAIMQISARRPTATAMTAMTLDHLSGGRFTLGLGVSGPGVVQGWYGETFSSPLMHTREYLEIIRRVIKRQEPVSFDGRFYQIPFNTSDVTLKPLRSTVHPLRDDLGIYLAAEGPKNVELAAEIADGWFPLWFSPRSDAYYRARLESGFVRRPNPLATYNFEVVCPVPVVIDRDLESAADKLRPLLALYIGGMGSTTTNFHKRVFERLGYEEQCKKIQDAYLAGRKSEAISGVTTEMVEDVSLVGSLGKIRDDLDKWRETVITTMLVSNFGGELDTIAELVLG